MNEKNVTENGKTTILEELPPDVAKFLEENNLRIKLEKHDEKNFVDQGEALRSSDGCWSAPGGPHC